MVFFGCGCCVNPYCPNPKDYWYRMKKREKLSGVELSTICRQLKLESADGKMRMMDVADTHRLT